MSLVDDITLDLVQKGWSYQLNILDSAQLAPIQSLYEGEFVPAKVGRGTNHRRDESIRGDWTSWVDTLAPSKELSPIMEILEQLKARANQRLFMGIKQFECHLAKYPTGSFYKTHSDKHERESTRVLSFIFYMNESWNKDDGGELVLYDRQGTEISRFFPLPGSMICFVSDDFPHQVLPGMKERRSLTGWMHTKLIY